MKKIDKMSRIGRRMKYSSANGEHYSAYIPKPLPPVPTINLTNLYPLLDKANTAIGRLDGMRMVLPDSSLFLYMYVRKEAILSSQIEGTQSSLSDLLLFEAHATPTVPINDVVEVSCHVSAMKYALERLNSLPLSLRLIKEIHAILMDNARGHDKMPGEFRTSQNWIGGTRPGNANFVPPPPEYLMECLGDFEKFLHDDKDKLPVLVKAALAHLQFETIHPFLDGNGRLGRLLITLILCIENVLEEPLLYLSLYLKTHKQEYYNHLQTVRENGDWESWIEFFLVGIIETANQATQTAQAIIKLFNIDRKTIESSGKSTATMLSIHTLFQKQAIAGTTIIKNSCKVSLPTVLRSLKTLESLEIIKEVSGKERNKVFIYSSYLKLLNQATELT